jgi:hypothetical protein
MQTDSLTHPSALPEPLARAGSWASRAHLAVPGLLTAGLAFRAGGFFPLTTGIAALALCLGLMLRITLADRPFAGWSRSAAVAALGAAALASWTLASSTWSHAPERALIEFDRTLLYGALLVLMALAPRRPGDLAVVLRWVLVALVAACVAGVASRVAPDVFPISSRYVAERLSFPLTYWNGMGLAAGLATILALHEAAADDEPAWMRVAATAVLPITTTALYFTFSRGAIAACAIGLVAFILLGFSRRLLVALAAAALPVVVTLWAAWSAGALATVRYFSGAGPAQGHRVALVIVASVLVAAAVRTLAARAELRVTSPHARRLARPTALRLTAAGFVLLLSVAVAFGLPGTLREEARTFGKGDFVAETGDARDRLTRLNANGRPDLWRASLDAFADQPLHGTGAGTFRLSWQVRRTYFWEVTDGHSLYLELLGELGVVGGLALALALLTPMAMALRRLGGRERQAHAAFAGAGIALLVHAGVDWDWEMPALFAWYVGAAGVVLARSAHAAGAGSVGRLPRLVAGLACLLLAVTPVLVATSQSHLDAATTAFHAGDCPTAVDAALSAQESLARAAADEIVGYSDLRGRPNTLALSAMRSAVARDPGNWQYRYGLAVAQALSGGDPRAAAAAALARNPQDPTAQDLVRAMRSPSPQARYRAAARARIPSE